MHIDTILCRIRDFAAAQGWRKARLAKEAGVPRSTLKNFDLGTWNPTADTLRKLEAVIPPEFAVAPEVIE